MSPLMRWVTRACCKRDTTGQGAAPRRPARRARTASMKPISIWREHDVAAGNDDRPDDHQHGQQAEQQRQACHAGLRTGDFERLIKELVSPSGASVGGSDERQYWHQKKQTETFKACGERGD